MRVLFVSGSYSNFYAIDNVVRELFRRGHEARLIAGMEKKQTISDDALRNAMAAHPNFVVDPLSQRRHGKNIARYLREALNYAHVLNDEEKRQWDLVKWERSFPAWLWRFLNTQPVRRKLKDRSFQARLREMERKIPVDTDIRKEIQRHNPDVVLLMPLLHPNSRETEYMRAARSLGIPTVYYLVSWDNLASTGTFHGYPDYSIVWNEPLADELTLLHDFPRNRTYFTGAPRFSYLFENPQHDILPKDLFHQQAGLDVGKPYLLYVCSTFLVRTDHHKELNEGTLILKLSDAFEGDPRTRDMVILVRPHPTNLGFVSKILDQKRPNIKVFPINGEIPDTEEKRRRYYSSIYHATAVAGVNTTAFLEASSLDKPCITVYSEQFFETQQLPHFHHLTDGNFLETAQGADGLVEIVGNIRNGMDVRAGERRAFVKRFLSPCDKPAPQACADALEEIVAKGKIGGA